MSRSGVDRSRRRRRWFAALTVSVTIVTSLLCGEVVMRVAHIEPLQVESLTFEVEPIDEQRGESSSEGHVTNQRLFLPDEVLGYTHLPGRFNVKLSDDYTFTMTHRQDMLRITQPDDSEDKADGRAALWIFGCSFTHGWSVNDEDTYPWRMQEMLPDHNVVNFGVSGYDQLHALLQFEQAIGSHPPPQVAIVTYAHFHDERNTFGRAYRKSTVAHISPRLRGTLFPFARIGPDYSVVIGHRPAEFRGLPLLRLSALANYVDDLIDRLDDRLIRSHDVSKALILALSRRCQQQGVELVVAGITQEPATWDILAFCLRHEIRQVDISFDYGNPDYMNAPHDPRHPSPAGQLIYAERLVTYLNDQALLSMPNGAVHLHERHDSQADLLRSRSVTFLP